MSTPDRSGLGIAGLTAAGAALTTPASLRRLVLVTRDRILETLALVTPGAPLVSPQLVTGLTEYRYRLVATTAAGHSAASGEGLTATGVATLTSIAYNRLTWTPVPRATGYAIYRTVGGATQGLIATVGAISLYDDVGAAGDDADPPDDNTSGTLGLFWSDQELLDIMVLGAKDLWRSFIDLHQDHFFTVDTIHVSLPASSDRLVGVPANVHRILSIEPRDTSPTSTSRSVVFDPQAYNSSRFKRARALATANPGNGPTISYAVTGAGAPVGAPTIYVAPAVSEAILIRLVYIPTLTSALTLDDSNPVPGESDAALVAYTVAFALAKDREDRSPDPNWLAVYATEKTSCLVAAAPRQEQVAPVVTGVFDELFGAGLSGDVWDDY